MDNLKKNIIFVPHAPSTKRHLQFVTSTIYPTRCETLSETA